MLQMHNRSYCVFIFAPGVKINKTAAVKQLMRKQGETKGDKTPFW